MTVGPWLLVTAEEAVIGLVRVVEIRMEEVQRREVRWRRGSAEVLSNQVASTSESGGKIGIVGGRRLAYADSSSVYTCWLEASPLERLKIVAPKVDQGSRQTESRGLQQCFWKHFLRASGVN